MSEDTLKAYMIIYEDGDVLRVVAEDYELQDFHDGIAASFYINYATAPQVVYTARKFKSIKLNRDNQDT